MRDDAFVLYTRESSLQSIQSCEFMREFVIIYNANFNISMYYMNVCKKDLLLMVILWFRQLSLLWIVDIIIKRGKNRLKVYTAGSLKNERDATIYDERAFKRKKKIEGHEVHKCEKASIRLYFIPLFNWKYTLVHPPTHTHAKACIFLYSFSI